MIGPHRIERQDRPLMERGIDIDTGGAEIVARHGRARLGGGQAMTERGEKSRASLAGTQNSCGGSEVRIIPSASARCGLLNQSHTRIKGLVVSFDSEIRE